MPLVFNILKAKVGAATPAANIYSRYEDYIEEVLDCGHLLFSIEQALQCHLAQDSQYVALGSSLACDHLFVPPVASQRETGTDLPFLAKLGNSTLVGHNWQGPPAYLLFSSSPEPRMLEQIAGDQTELSMVPYSVNQEWAAGEPLLKTGQTKPGHVKANIEFLAGFSFAVDPHPLTFGFALPLYSWQEVYVQRTYDGIGVPGIPTGRSSPHITVNILPFTPLIYSAGIAYDKPVGNVTTDHYAVRQPVYIRTKQGDGYGQGYSDSGKSGASYTSVISPFISRKYHTSMEEPRLSGRMSGIGIGIGRSIPMRFSFVPNTRLGENWLDFNVNHLDGVTKKLFPYSIPFVYRTAPLASGWGTRPRFEIGTSQSVPYYLPLLIRSRQSGLTQVSLALAPNALVKPQPLTLPYAHRTKLAGSIPQDPKSGRASPLSSPILPHTKKVNETAYTGESLPVGSATVVATGLGIKWSLLTNTAQGHAPANSVNYDPNSIGPYPEPETLVEDLIVEQNDTVIINHQFKVGII